MPFTMILKSGGWLVVRAFSLGDDSWLVSCFNPDSQDGVLFLAKKGKGLVEVTERTSVSGLTKIRPVEWWNVSGVLRAQIRAKVHASPDTLS